MSSLSDIVSTAAPIVGKVIGSFVPGADLVISGLSKLFGADGEDDLKAKIASDPEAYVKLQSFEREHEAKMLQLLLSDKQNARSRDIEIAKATGKKDWIVNTLAMTFVVGTFAYVGLTMWGKAQYISDIFNQLIDIVMLICGYFYGASNNKR